MNRISEAIIITKNPRENKRLFFEFCFEKISSGADAVQLYTGMVYKGPGIVKEIKKDLISILKKEKFKNIRDAVGINS